MITLKDTTIELIHNELKSIPEKYQKPFNSLHEGLGVLREEYLELEKEIFFGEKVALKEAADYYTELNHVIEESGIVHKLRVKKEAVQVAAMCCRIIQELT